jgi:uncharacterized damage-inducible protein DinB/predicted enzyme related to lactoylglutathione lyase
MTSSVRHLTVDSRDPYALGSFWAAALGGRLASDDEPGDPEALVLGASAPLLFVQVPEGKAGKNRLHLDLQPATTRAAEVERLRGLGAVVVDDRVQPDGRGWVVMADPEGNEFCVEGSAQERDAPPRDTGERELPPLHTAGERELLEQLLDWYRDGVVAKVEGLAQDDATTSPLRSGTTVAGLVKHLALVEDSWFTDRLGGGGEPEPWASAPFDEDPDWEFHSAAGEPLEASVELYRQACARSRAVAAARGLDDEGTTERGRTFSLRFALLHLVEETARHLGHLDVLCELADGRTGE